MKRLSEAQQGKVAAAAAGVAAGDFPDLNLSKVHLYNTLALYNQ